MSAIAPATVVGCVAVTSAQAVAAVTRRLPLGIFLRLIRRIAIRQRGLSNRDFVQLDARRAITIDRGDDGIRFHRYDWRPRGRICQ